MFENMLEYCVAREELERLYDTPAWRHRAALVRRKGQRQLLTDLTAASSRILLSLGRALVSAGERLDGKRTPGRAATV